MIAGLGPAAVMTFVMSMSSDRNSSTGLRALDVDDMLIKRREIKLLCGRDIAKRAVAELNIISRARQKTICDESILSNKRLSNLILAVKREWFWSL